MHVEFYNATAVSCKHHNFDAEKQQDILADMLMKKFNTVSKQNNGEEVHSEDEKRVYNIKATTNLCDVSIKPWNKVHTYVKANHKINKDFVDFFVNHKFDEFKKAN